MCPNPTPPGLPSTLERLSDRAMPGRERLAVGAWWLRADLGATGRANSAWAAGPPDRPVAVAVDHVVAWYRGRGLPPRFQQFDDANTGLVVELDRRGWSSTVDSLVMVAEVEAVPTLRSDRARRFRDVEIESEPTGLFRQLMADDRRLAEVTTTDLPQRYVTVSEDGGLLGGGMSTIDGSWAAVLAMKTRPGARRRRVATTVLALLAEATAGVGERVGRMWLQVQSDNDAAIALYHRLGFRPEHRYRYRFAPEPARESSGAG